MRAIADNGWGRFYVDRFSTLDTHACGLSNGTNTPRIKRSREFI
jgi:hypothetical protein